MRTLFLATALLSGGLLVAPTAFAQQQQPAPNSTSRSQDSSTTRATKQRTDGSDVTSQYNFPTPGGQYSARPGMNQGSGGNNMAQPK